MQDLTFRSDSPEKLGGKQVWTRQAPAGHSDFILRSIVDDLELTPVKLARLIGKAHTNIYSWFSNGVSPSQSYWVRIAYLQLLKSQGISLSRVRTINWTSPPFEIEWWPGAEPSEENAA